MDVKQMVEQAQQLRARLAELKGEMEAVQSRVDAINATLRHALEEAGEAVSNLSEEEFQAVLAEFNDRHRISVTIVYATRDLQHVAQLNLPEGATIEDGIAVSGVVDRFPALDLTQQKVGIHGTIQPLSQVLRDGDRIEIYRPVEPTESARPTTLPAP